MCTNLSVNMGSPRKEVSAGEIEKYQSIRVKISFTVLPCRYSVYSCNCCMLKLIKPINNNYEISYAKLAPITCSGKLFTSSFISMLHSFCFTDVMP